MRQFCLGWNTPRTCCLDKQHREATGRSLYDVLPRLSWSRFHVLAVLSRLSCPRCTVPAVLCQLPCPSCNFFVVMSWLPFPGCPVPAALSKLTCPCGHVLSCSLCLVRLSRYGYPVQLSCTSCPVLSVMSWVSCYGYPVLFWTSCLVLIVLYWLFWPRYSLFSFAVLPAFSGCPVLSFGSRLSYPGCPVLTVLMERET